MKKNKNVNIELKNERKQKIIQFLKDMIAPMVLLIIVIALFVYGANMKKLDDVVPMPELYEYDGTTNEFVLEKGDLVFKLDPTTTMFTVTNKKTGKVWDSNPEDILAGATDEITNKLKSVLIVEYSDEVGAQYETYGTSKYSVEKQIYNVSQSGDCVTVDYSIGDVAKVYMCPPVCLADEFEAYIAQIEAANSTKIARDTKGSYKKWDKDKVTKYDEEQYEVIKERYPIVEEQPIYVLRDKLGRATMEKIERAFLSINYNEEMLKKDQELDSQGTTQEKPIFNVTVEYRLLEGNKLSVTIPFNKIETPENYPMTYLTVLPYFGAGSKDDEGYIVVPEGGGSIINYNNGKTSMEAYATKVFGRDLCLTKDSIIHDPITTYGVFGMAEEGNSFICIPSDGNAYCSVYADIYRPKSPCNNAYFRYEMFEREIYDMGSTDQTVNSSIYCYIENLPENEKIEQTYVFIDSDNYVDMAKGYQDYLINKYGSAFDKNTDTSTPVNIELIGAVDKKEQVLGIPVSRPLELTSFNEATEIAKDIHEVGLDNVSFKYVGWCNGGVKQTVFSSIKPVSRLGGKSDLQDFSNEVKNLGYNLTLNGIVMYAMDSNIFDGFFSFGDAAKTIAQERMEIFKYSAVTYALREGTEAYYLVHTPLSMKYADRLIEACNKYGAGISFDDIGKDLAADYYDDDFHSRESVKVLHAELLKKIKDDGKYLAINQGNEYAMPYASIVTNMDLKGSDYTILDENIPFLQLAIHGYVNYTGESINISGNQDDEILYSAAYGAGLSFTFMKESAFTLQDTLYTHYYGCDYDSWRQNMIDIYNRYNSELGHIFNQKMIGHEYIADNVTCTTYEDGTKVYVNFGFTEYLEYGVYVPARDYKVVR